MPSRRILFIDHTARMGGGEIALLHLVTRLDPSRYEPIVVLLADGPLRERLTAAGVDVRIVPLGEAVGETRKDSLGSARSLLRFGAASAAISSVRRLARLIREIEPALVHTNSLKSDVLGGVAARRARTPILWHVRDRIAADYLPPKVAFIFRKLCRLLPTVIIVNSRATLDTLGKGAARKAFVVHDGTPIDDHLPESPPNERPLIGLVGRLTRWKGQHVFLDAAAIVLATHPTARFQLIGSALFGEDDYERELRAQAARLGIEYAVEFCGFCADVQARMMRLDILAHASITGEPFGQVVIEAMACGKPIVATRGGGIPEIVVDNETGILVPMADAPAMARAIEMLIADPARAKAMGLAGRQRVMQQFRIEHTAANVMRVYDEVLNDGA